MNERIVGVLSLVLVTAACGQVTNPDGGGGGDDGDDDVGVDVDAASADVDAPPAPIDAPPPPIDAVPALDCSTITPPAGFTRENVNGFSQLFNRSGYACMDVPNTGGSLCIVAPRRTGYMTVRFDVPADTTGLSGLDFRWSESQYVDGAGVYGPIVQRGYYVSISTCPGDFRVPAPGSTSTEGDPTFVQGCRYLRYFNGNISDPQQFMAPFTGTGDDHLCPLRPGGVYYFNIIPATPMDGYTVGEGCGDPNVERCGIQMQVGATI